MKKALLALLILFLPLTAEAATTKGKHTTQYPKTVLSSVAMNGAAATRTFTLSRNVLAGYGRILFWVDFDYATAAGAISLTCTAGPADADRDYQYTICNGTEVGGTCTTNFAGVFTTVSLSADTKWLWVMDTMGVHALSCVAAHGGTPTASELITIKYTLVAE